MKSKKRASEGGISPDLTSFSDIANLLIIFFILTTSLVRPFGRRMDMPASAKPPETRQQDNTPTVRVTADRLMLSEGEGNEREVTMNELRADLWRRNFPSRKENERAVVVETAPEVTYERYYNVVTAIAAAGGVVARMTE